MATAQVTMQDAADATGDGTAIPFAGPFGDAEKVRVQVSGTFSATVTYEGTVDGSNWVAFAATDASTTSTAAEILLFETAGLAEFRARVSAYTSGNVTVTAGAYTPRG